MDDSRLLVALNLTPDKGGVITNFTKVFNFSDWEEDLHTRSNIIHAIIKNQRSEQLQRIIHSGWDVNEILKITAYCGELPVESCKKSSTALQEAALNFWQDGIRILVTAGADTNLCLTGEPPLSLVLYQPRTENQLEAVKQLLHHGADANCKSILKKESPLMRAITQSADYDFDTKVVGLLLQHGADPSIEQGSFLGSPKYLTTYCVELMTLKLRYLSHVLGQDINDKHTQDHKKSHVKKANAALLEKLLEFGADTHCPILHTLMTVSDEHNFLQEHLDMFFRSGGDIQRHYNHGVHETALEYALTNCGHQHGIRWLVRHGSDTTRIGFRHLTLSKYHLYFTSRNHGLLRWMQVGLVLLGIGVRVQPSVLSHLHNMRQSIEHFLQNVLNESQFLNELRAQQDKSAKAQREEQGRESTKVCISTICPEYRKQQMSDLEEFSDETLHLYPENPFIEKNTIQQRELSLSMISSMIDHLSQPRTLQWWCRCCIRESLVSLHPSVVKILQVPPGLKRFILCHEL